MNWLMALAGSKIHVVPVGKHTGALRDTVRVLIDSVPQINTATGCTYAGAHVAWMPFVMEEDEASNPSHGAAFGTQSIVADAQDLADLIEQARRRWHNGLAMGH